MMDETRRVIAEAVAEAETFKKSAQKAAARVTDLFSTDRDLFLQTRKLLARSRSHLKTPRPAPTIDWEQESAHLKTADAHITDARKRIQRQRELIRQLGKLHSSTHPYESLSRDYVQIERASGPERYRQRTMRFRYW